MKRATEKEIAAKLKEWAKLRAKKERIEADRDQAIEPLRARFERRCAPILEKARLKLDPIEPDLISLQEEITALMLRGIAEDGELKLTRVATATAVAEVVTHAQREINPKSFFESIPPSQRGQAFWSCLKVLIGNAEKFLGDRLKDLAHAKETHRVTITAKEGAR
jgi:hypothetical protein